MNVKKMSEETKRKISASLKANHPMCGKHWSEEVRENKSIQNRPKVV
jgi:hypothetical protein